MDYPEAEKELEKLKHDEIIRMMQKYHDDLIAYAKTLRLKIKKGQEYQEGIELQVAEKNGAINIDGIWVERYPIWKLPKKIEATLKRMKKDREKLIKDTDLRKMLKMDKSKK